MLAETRRLTKLLACLDETPDRTVGRFRDLRLTSHFQPIYSLSHARVVGHEALLRARDPAENDVAPPDVFNACRNGRELAWCDSLSRVVHMANFKAHSAPSQWLFLNVHPDVFQLLAQPNGQNYLVSVINHFQLQGDRMVLEVLESAVRDSAAFEASVEIARRAGCLIAVDDFGAGHSNFDRVWRLQPDIVKLDRSLVERAARDRRAQRVVSQMVSLLHECGAMVLMEGVETLDEALLAMESDADLVQGYYFGRPQPTMMPTGHAPSTLTGLYAGLGERRQHQRHHHRNRIAPYQSAVENAGSLLGSGHSMSTACQLFLSLPESELCYLLDVNGYQIGDNLWQQDSTMHLKPAYEPLSDSQGACWARRPYFRRAIEAVGQVQITRPYRTLHGNHTCVTVSYGFEHWEGTRCEVRVMCGDLIWTEGA